MIMNGDADFTWAITKALFIVVGAIASLVGVAWVATKNVLPK